MAVFLGPLHTTALSLCSSRLATDITFIPLWGELCVSERERERESLESNKHKHTMSACAVSVP